MRHLFASLLIALPFALHAHVLSSPDGQLRVDLRIDDPQHLVYSVQRAGQPVVLPSRLGLVLEGADWGQGLRIVGVGPVTHPRERYTMAVGKRSHVDVRANLQTTTLANAKGQRMELTLRVANDGLAWRYTVAEPALARKVFVQELSSLKLAPDARAWLQPMSVAQTGWKRVNPSYEEHYQQDIAVGTPSPSPAGWVFPALFRSGSTWLALTEAGMDGRFHASRLRAESPEGEYRLGTPMPAEVFTGGGLLADEAGTLVTPWRVLAIGSLKTLVESTLGTDLAAPAIAFDPALVQPGQAAWSWALLKDEGTVFEVQKRFIDHAADMHWRYTLVDADWDRKIGDAKMKELVDYAKARGVGILVWYNSSGAWNDTEYTPKGALLTPAARAHEFARLKAMGVKGLKIDFFAGDGASMQAYYVDLLNETAAAGLLVNFHGATLPRGWARTYPNLMTAEAVKGFEFATFGQPDQDAVARHAAMLPFTRNLFDPMDFTPMVFGDIPGVERRTRNGFELAEAVLFLSGIQHMAETPEGMATVPPAVKALLQDLPARWDDVRFLAGEPGRYVVLARRAGARWFIAGINADDSPRTVALDLAFLGKRSGLLLTDGEGPRAFAVGRLAAPHATLTLAPRGGFVARFP